MQELKLESIEKQGFPFWCGDITVEKEIDVVGENPVINFELNGVNALIVEINGIKKTYLYCGTVRLSEFNAYGKTNIKITLINNLRNLLGPHHLKRGESIRVTPGDFYKEKCIWDMNTEDKWDNSYCFTITGVGLGK